MTDKVKLYLAAVLVASLLLNVFFMQNYFKRKPSIVYGGQVIEQPVVVISVKPGVTVAPHTVVRPQMVIPAGSPTASVLLSMLEKATPAITAESFIIVQNKNKQFIFPKTVAGSLELGYLKYKFNMSLKAKVVYSSPESIPIELGLLYYYYNKNMIFTPEIMLPFVIPFTDAKVYLGAGFDMASVSSGVPCLDNSFIQVGVGFKYTGEVVPFIGMSLGF